MHVTEEMSPRLFPEEIVEDGPGTAFRPTRDDICAQRMDRGGDMGAENVYWTDLLEQEPHLVIRDLSLGLQWGRRSATSEPEPNSLDLDHLPMDILIPVGKAGSQAPWSIHVSMDDKPAPPLEGDRHLTVLSVDRLTDLRSHFVESPGGASRPEVSHPLVVTGCSRRRGGTGEFEAENVSNCPLAGPVVGQVDQVSQDEDRLAHPDHPA
jgi:hypothetical protein